MTNRGKDNNKIGAEPFVLTAEGQYNLLGALKALVELYKAFAKPKNLHNKINQENKE
jgi:hypothetical protein